VLTKKRFSYIRFNVEGFEGTFGTISSIYDPKFWLVLQCIQLLTSFLVRDNINFGTDRKILRVTSAMLAMMLCCIKTDTYLSSGWLVRSWVC
jgi:hypothetical protein